MKKSEFTTLVREQISKILKEDLENTKVIQLQTGDNVRIPTNLTSDPFNRGGQTGEVIFTDDEIALIQFPDKGRGIYSLNIFEDPNTRVIGGINEAKDPNSQIFNLVEYALQEIINDNSEYADIHWKYRALEDVMKRIAKHLNITKISEASEEEVERQKELNKELEKTADIKKKIDSELNEKKEDGDVSDDYFVFYLNSENQWTQSTKKVFKSMNDAVNYIGDKKRLKVFKMVNTEIEKTDPISKYPKEMVGENKDEDVWDIDDEKEPPKSAIKKKDSVSTIANKLQQTKKEMTTVLGQYKSSEGKEKEKHLNRLKELTKIKKELEKSL